MQLHQKVNLKHIQKINFRPSNHITGDEDCSPEFEDPSCASYRSGNHLSKNNSKQSLEHATGTISQNSLETHEHHPINDKGNKNQFLTQPNEKDDA